MSVTYSKVTEEGVDKLQISEDLNKVSKYTMAELQARKDECVVAKDRIQLQIDEVDALIAEATALGVT